jgi:hypothetical protein
VRPLDDALTAWATPMEDYPRWQLVVVLWTPLLLIFQDWLAVALLVISYLIARLR